MSVKVRIAHASKSGFHCVKKYDNYSHYMNLEKLGLMLLSTYLTPFEGVKNHLSRALGECFKAAEETVKIVQRGNDQLRIHPLQTALIAKVLSPLEVFLRQSGDRLSPDDLRALLSEARRHGEHLHPLKAHIVQSLIDTLDEEIDRVQVTLPEGATFKIDALQTVKRVLTEHLSTSSAASGPKTADVVNTAPFQNDAADDAADTLISLHTESMSEPWRPHDVYETLESVLQVEADHPMNPLGATHGSPEAAHEEPEHDAPIELLAFRAVKTA